ncbi:MAG: TetR/AcrR family transcriptional regulator [Bacteroidales bacterium]|nr:TetR/AcrR family transcriptional regulator [Bacteroidales bacterium]MDT8374339.1 TetR/AcrR family transcriptional regulator [Bacteroidales bacterium]
MVKKRKLIGQTQSKIFDAATEVFEEKGYAGARMQVIADRAGINKALLHYYFRTKDQLFMAVFHVLLKKMFEKILSIFMEEATFKEKMRRFLDEHIEFLIRNPKLPLFLLNEISRNPALAEGLRETLQYSQIRDLIYEKHSKELKGYGIKKSDMPQLMITIVGMSVFPVAARDMIAIMMPQLNDSRKFNAFMQGRKDFAAGFVMTALKNRKK